jgi:hypothetical protein
LHRTSATSIQVAIVSEQYLRHRETVRSQSIQRHFGITWTARLLLYGCVMNASDYHANHTKLTPAHANRPTGDLSSSSRVAGPKTNRQLIVQRERRLAPSALGDLWLGRISVGDELGRPVVVRQMAANDLTPDERAAVIMRGRSLRKLRGSHLIRMLDVVEQNGSLVTVSEHLVTAPLLNVLGLAIHNKCPLPAPVVIRIVLDTTAAAIATRESATALGLNANARLLLPEGIHVAEFGAVLLSEIGVLAKVARGKRIAWRSSILSQLSPEELQVPSQFSETSEVYSLGVLMWELLANHRFLRDTEHDDLCKRMQAQECPSLERFASLSHPRLAPVVRLVQQASARKRESRYKTLRELHDALKRLPSRLVATEAEVALAIRTSAGMLLERSRLKGQSRVRECVNVIRSCDDNDAPTVPTKVVAPSVPPVAEHKDDGVEQPKVKDEDERPTLRNCPKAKSVPPATDAPSTFEPVSPPLIRTLSGGEHALPSAPSKPTGVVPLPQSRGCASGSTAVEVREDSPKSSSRLTRPVRVKALIVSVFTLLVSGVALENVSSGNTTELLTAVSAGVAPVKMLASEVLKSTVSAASAVSAAPLGQASASIVQLPELSADLTSVKFAAALVESSTAPSVAADDSARAAPEASPPSAETTPVLPATTAQVHQAVKPPQIMVSNLPVATGLRARAPIARPIGSHASGWSAKTSPRGKAAASTRQAPVDDAAGKAKRLEWLLR